MNARLIITFFIIIRIQLLSLNLNGKTCQAYFVSGCRIYFQPAVFVNCIRLVTNTNVAFSIFKQKPGTVGWVFTDWRNHPLPDAGVFIRPFRNIIDSLFVCKCICPVYSSGLSQSYGVTLSLRCNLKTIL